MAEHFGEEAKWITTIPASPGYAPMECWSAYGLSIFVTDEGSFGINLFPNIRIANPGQLALAVKELIEFENAYNISKFKELENY